MKPHTLAFCLVAALASPVVSLAKNSSAIRSPLANTGVDTDATGSVTSSLSLARSSVALSLSKLTPGAAYSLKVGETVETDFIAANNGSARLLFTTPAPGNKLALDFDPRGKTVSVLDETGAVVLEAVVSGQGEPATIVVDERTDLSPVAGVKGKASARFTAQKQGRRAFEVSISGTTESSLRLFVNGIEQGTVAIKGSSGRIAFAALPSSKQLLLDFDPRSAAVELFGADGALKFGGKLEAKATNVNVATRATRSVLIPATAAAGAGQAEAKLRIKPDATKDFSVELEDVPVGTYEFVVNEIVRGTINVTARTEGGTQGELEFSSDEDDDSDEIPLTFDPVGTTLTVRQGATVFFLGVFEPGTGSTTLVVTGQVSLITEALASTGFDSNARGEAEFSTEADGEMEFEVEVEALDAGHYQLFVGGTLRGTISAATTANGGVRGKLNFQKAGAAAAPLAASRRRGDDGGGDDNGGGSGSGTDDGPGDDNGGGGGGGDSTTPRLPLNFDPRGQLIEIKSTAGTFFSHVFGDGSAPTTGGDGTASVPGEITVALISSGSDANATAKAEWKRNERGGESFEVEIEDVAVGSYELLVGGTVRGAVSVVGTDRGTRGKLEFDDEPSGIEQPLTFDPRRQLITLRKDGVAYFQRTFPNGS